MVADYQRQMKISSFRDRVSGDYQRDMKSLVSLEKWVDEKCIIFNLFIHHPYYAALISY